MFKFFITSILFFFCFIILIYKKINFFLNYFLLVFINLIYKMGNLKFGKLLKFIALQS